AFCSARRSMGLLWGSGPPDFTAMAISRLMRVNAFAILFQRANIVALRVSKIRPTSVAPARRALFARARHTTEAQAAPVEVRVQGRRVRGGVRERHVAVRADQVHAVARQARAGRRVAPREDVE